MSVLRPLPELEAELDSWSSSWRALTDREYTQRVDDWNRLFRGPVSRREKHRSGGRALDDLSCRLPADVVMFSGVRVPEIANLGGQTTAGYFVGGLRGPDIELCARLELLLSAADLSWTLLLSHETGSMYNEEFWVRRTS